MNGLGNDGVKSLLQHSFSSTVIRRAVKVAIVVGTVLNLVNHYGVLTGDSVSTSAVAQMVLNYVVPYLVSTHGQAMSRLKSFPARNPKNYEEELR